MQDWEKSIINTNLSKLVEVTPKLDVLKITKLKEGRILSGIECDQLTITLNNRGRRDQAYEFYNIAVTRRGAFDKLIEVFEDDVDAEAGEILKKARVEYYRNQGITPPAQVPATTSSSSQDTNESIPIPGGATSAYTVDGSQKKEYLDLVQKARPLNVVLEPPVHDMITYFKSKDKYGLPVDNKGLALLLNIKYFDKFNPNDEDEPDQTRLGSEQDIKYLRTILKGVGYQIFKENEIDQRGGTWYKDALLQIVRDFRQACMDTQPRSIIVFIGSHGEFNKVLTSDKPILNFKTRQLLLSSVLLYEDVVREFYHDKCPALEGNPKIFLINACQNFEPVVETEGPNLEPPVSDMVVCTAQVPGYPAFRSPQAGSWLIHCFTFVMMKQAKSKSLQEMFRMVTEFMEGIKEKEFPYLEHGQIPDVRNMGLKELYFFMKSKKNEIAA